MESTVAATNRSLYMAYVTDGDSILAVTPKRENTDIVYFCAKKSMMNILIETMSHEIIKRVIIATLYSLRGNIAAEEEKYIASLNSEDKVNYFRDFAVRGNNGGFRGGGVCSLEDDITFMEFCIQLQNVAHVYYDINVRPVA